MTENTHNDNPTGEMKRTRRAIRRVMIIDDEGNWHLEERPVYNQQPGSGPESDSVAMSNEKGVSNIMDNARGNKCWGCKTRFLSNSVKPLCRYCVFATYCCDKCLREDSDSHKCTEIDDILKKYRPINNATKARTAVDHLRDQDLIKQ